MTDQLDLTFNTDMSLTELLAGEISDDIVKAAAFRTLPDVVMEMLMDDEHLVEFAGAVRTLNADLGAQIALYIAAKQNGEPCDYDWYRRAISLKGRVNSLDRKLGPKRQQHQERIAKIRRETQAAAHAEFLASREGRQESYRRAIARHRYATLITADLEPSEADRDLWSVLDDEDEQVTS